MAAVGELDLRRDIDPNILYELTALLGEGSYGAVYKGQSRQPVDNLSSFEEKSSLSSSRRNTEVAIKIIPDADDDLTALGREIKFLQVTCCIQLNNYVKLFRSM